MLTYLGAVYGEAGRSVELLVADVTLEVLGLLVVDENLVVIKLSVAVPFSSQGEKKLMVYDSI